MIQKVKGEDWLISREKRSIDIAVGSMAGSAAIVPAAMGAVAFALESRINPIFTQDRIGRYDEIMTMFKLRTMPFDFDMCDGSAGCDDYRASRVGRILRHLAIDETPQFFNVLRGDMSIVGPRPLVAGDINKTLDLLNAKEQSEWLRARYVARPGLVSSFVTEQKTLKPQSEEYLLKRVELDCEYYETASLLTDLQIICAAFKTVADSAASTIRLTPNPKESYETK